MSGLVVSHVQCECVLNAFDALKAFLRCRRTGKTQDMNPRLMALLSRIFGRTNPSNIWSRLIRQLNVDYPQILSEIIEDTESLSESVVMRHQNRAELQSLRLQCLFDRAVVTRIDYHGGGRVGRRAYQPDVVVRECPHRAHFEHARRCGWEHRLMRAFEARGDCHVVDEPFYAAELAAIFVTAPGGAPAGAMPKRKQAARSTTRDRTRRAGRAPRPRARTAPRSVPQG